MRGEHECRYLTAEIGSHLRRSFSQLRDRRKRAGAEKRRNGEPVPCGGPAEGAMSRIVYSVDPTFLLMKFSPYRGSATTLFQIRISASCARFRAF
jgi:hypothetical protein